MDLIDFQNAAYTLEERAETLLKELHDIDPIEGYHCLSFHRIYGGDTIEFTGHETWSYGGEADRDFDIPLAAVLDGGKACALKELRRKNRANREAQRERERDLRQYEYLRNKLFGETSQ